MADVRRYANPTELIHGPASLARIGSEIARLGGTRAMVVTDPGLAAAGVLDLVVSALEAGGIDAARWPDVPPDPTFDDIDRIVADVRATGCDTVVSVGGGSALAAGRAAAVAATHEVPSASLAGVGRATTAPLLSVCVPTTAGSGGEVSRQATITDASGHKSGMQGWSVAARLAILDAELLASVPRRQVVASGIDALVHALEAYLSRRATPLTDALALPAFETLFRDVPPAADSADFERNDRMLLASTMANIACGNAGLGLVHGLNKGVTYLMHARGYAALSYGELHAALLPAVMAFNAPAAPERMARLAVLMGAAGDGSADAVAADGVELLKAWLAGMDAPRRLPWDDVRGEDLDLAVDDVAGRQMAEDNARPSTRKDLKALLEQSIEGW